VTLFRPKGKRKPGTQTIPKEGDHIMSTRQVMIYLDSLIIVIFCQFNIACVDKTDKEQNKIPFNDISLENNANTNTFEQFEDEEVEICIEAERLYNNFISYNNNIIALEELIELFNRLDKAESFIRNALLKYPNNNKLNDLLNELLIIKGDKLRPAQTKIIKK
jgi:hypothetical protein